MNHISPFSKRFSLVEVGVICLLVAAVAGASGSSRWWILGNGPSQRPAMPAEIGTAQHLGEKGAAVWMQLQRRYGTRNSRNAEEWVARDYFQDKRGGVFLDVGAAD